MDLVSQLRWMWDTVLLPEVGRMLAALPSPIRLGSHMEDHVTLRALNTARNQVGAMPSIPGEIQAVIETALDWTITAHGVIAQYREHPEEWWMRDQAWRVLGAATDYTRAAIAFYNVEPEEAGLPDTLSEQYEV